MAMDDRFVCFPGTKTDEKKTQFLATSFIKKQLEMVE
jgi:hypothetical protein|tara:strand:+ start:414 stop:524 length:111 start_codon:yes stop_codon:yes gene_type:complete